MRTRSNLRLVLLIRRAYLRGHVPQLLGHRKGLAREGDSIGLAQSERRKEQRVELVVERRQLRRVFSKDALVIWQRILWRPEERRTIERVGNAQIKRRVEDAIIRHHKPLLCVA